MTLIHHFLLSYYCFQTCLPTVRTDVSPIPQNNPTLSGSQWIEEESQVKSGGWGDKIAACVAWLEEFIQAMQNFHWHVDYTSSNWHQELPLRTWQSQPLWLQTVLVLFNLTGCSLGYFCRGTQQEFQILASFRPIIQHISSLPGTQNRFSLVVSILNRWWWGAEFSSILNQPSRGMQ